MSKLKITAEAYLKENIDDHTQIKPWPEMNNLPVFLKSIYRFYEMTILNTRCVLLEILDETPGIDTIQKQIKRIGELTNKQVVLYYKEISIYRRKSLIKNRISFVIEDGQMFLPFLSLDLKKEPQIKKKTKVTAFSTSTQIAYLYFLYNKNVVLNTTEFAEKLGFSLMTASRALNDLYDAKLLTYITSGKTGRSKKYQRISDPEYFKVGKALMKTPVKKIVYVRRMPEDGLIAGLEALSDLTMINPPRHLVRAISQKQFDIANLKIIRNTDIIKDESLVELEIWTNDPKQFTDNNYVDYMSLYASLREIKDERIEQALEEILRGEGWFTD